jgi:hypothetical protein
MRVFKMRKLFSVAVLVATLSAVRVVARKYFSKARKVRWAYLSLIPIILLVVVAIFEWRFVEHLMIAMGLEAIFHHVTAAAIGDEVADVAAEVAVEVAEKAV